MKPLLSKSSIPAAVSRGGRAGGGSNGKLTRTERKNTGAQDTRNRRRRTRYPPRIRTRKSKKNRKKKQQAHAASEGFRHPKSADATGNRRRTAGGGGRSSIARTEIELTWFAAAPAGPDRRRRGGSETRRGDERESGLEREREGDDESGLRNERGLFYGPRRGREDRLPKVFVFYTIYLLINYTCPNRKRFMQ